MTTDTLTDTWIGRRVALYPSDTYARHADVIGVDSHGWEFEITGPDSTATKPGYRIGDRLYVSHSMRLTMVELDDHE